MSMSRLDQLLSRRHFVIGSSALAAATLSGGLWGCASDEPLGSTGPSDSPEENAADLVLYNGHVQTMVSESEVASGHSHRRATKSSMWAMIQASTLS